MPNKAPEQFDCRRFVEIVRAEIEEETKGMSSEQVVEYYRNYPYDSPHAEIDAKRLPWWESEKKGDDDEPGSRNFDSIAFVRWARANNATEGGR